MEEHQRPQRVGAQTKRGVPDSKGSGCGDLDDRVIDGEFEPHGAEHMAEAEQPTHQQHLLSFGHRREHLLNETTAEQFFAEANRSEQERAGHQHRHRSTLDEAPTTSYNSYSKYMASNRGELVSTTDTTTATAPDPGHILQIGLGFWASKTLLSAVELEMFTVLGSGSMTRAKISSELGLHDRSSADFLDALVSLNLLRRDGDAADARYSNTADTALFLDKTSPAYIGGILEMANARLYPFWANLTEALHTGEVQNESKSGGDFFGTLYEDEARLEQFVTAMRGLQTGNFMALLDKVDLSTATTLVDLGGASGFLCALAAQRHPHLQVINVDLPPVEPIARRTFEQFGVSDRATAHSSDLFADPFPASDVAVFGNLLHDFDEASKRSLISKAYDALNPGGRMIAIENVIDDARRENTFGLLMSLNMLIETPGGADYTASQFDGWCRAAGFSRTEIVPLAGPSSAAIAYK
jgi:SAM-dependent methyltransferase